MFVPKKSTGDGNSIFICGSNELNVAGMSVEEFEKIKFPQRGNEYQETNPVLFPYFEGKNIVKVVCGGMHTLCLNSDGEVYGFGVNSEGQLGRYIEEDVIEGSQRVKVDTNDDICVSRKQSARIFAPDLMMLPDNCGKVVDVVAGNCFSCVLTEEGHVYACGLFRDATEIIGFPKYQNAGKGKQETIRGNHDKSPQFVPIKMEFPHVGRKSMIVEIVKIVCGDCHVLCLGKNGIVYAFGSCANGQIPTRQRSSKYRSVQRTLYPCVVYGHMETHKKSKVVDIYAYGCCSLLLTENVVVKKKKPGSGFVFGSGTSVIRRLLGCGVNVNGELALSGARSREELSDDDILLQYLVMKWTEIPAFNGVTVKYVVGGEHHAFCVDSTGSVLCWGMNDCHQLGINLPNEETNVPVELKELTKRELHGTNIHWMEQYSDPVIQEQSPFPLSIDDTENYTVKNVVSGPQSGYAVTHQGSVFAWGPNDSRQLGFRPSDDDFQTDPRPIFCRQWRCRRVLDVAATSFHTVFIVEAEKKDAT